MSSKLNSKVTETGAPTLEKPADTAPVNTQSDQGKMDQGQTEQGEQNKAKPEKLSMEVLSDEEHAKQFPRTNLMRVFNKLDSPQALDLCPGKMQRAFHTVDGIKQFNPNSPAACRVCPGRHIARMAPRETRDVPVAIDGCFGSTHINAQIREGYITVRPVNADGVLGEKIKKFNV